MPANILVVEDEPAIQELLALNLEFYPDAAWTRYVTLMAQGNSSATVSPSGNLGLFQLSLPRLADLNYVTNLRKDASGKWTADWVPPLSREKFLASGSSDKTVIIWDLATSKPSKTLDDFDAGINSVAYSPNGSMLVTTTSDEDVILLDADGTEIASLEGHEGVVNDAIIAELKARGHDAEKTRPFGINGCATAVLIDPASGNRIAGADRRRDCYAIAY